jgi:hypothetical protein
MLPVLLPCDDPRTSWFFQCVFLRGFSQDERAPNRPVCVVYYMLSSGGFDSTCLQSIAKGGSLILGRHGQTRAMFQASTARRPVHTLTTAEGLLSWFRHRLHGTVGMIFLCTCGLCCYMLYVYYMLYACYMSSSEPSSGSSGSMRANVMHPNRCMNTSIWDMNTSIWDTKLQTGGSEG